ncbi:MAG: hypothetical protein KatS3mg130_1225 [Candidatus Sumerlaea sp.]|jgi:hypothetical protein|nr:MAG: hypothetical protein KatS3mg130_1225 [Candidatus Sumerlaea sp.]
MGSLLLVFCWKTELTPGKHCGRDKFEVQISKRVIAT